MFVWWKLACYRLKSWNVLQQHLANSTGSATRLDLYTGRRSRLHCSQYKLSECHQITLCAHRSLTLQEQASFNAVQPQLKKKDVRTWNKVPTLLLTKNPGLFQDPMKNFPGPFRSLRMFKYKEKTAFTYNIQSVVHCRKFSMKQNVI